MTPIEGIDISSNNTNWRSLPTNGLQICIIKLTQGTDYHWAADPEVVAWARSWARWVMGYHWVDPTVTASAQATAFTAVYEQLGLDGWWLDEEDPRTPAVPWATLVPSLFDLVAARLGAERGGNYKGRFFHPELNPFCSTHNWWDPDYRGQPDWSGVMLAQYTSTGGPGGSPLDRSRVLDEPAFLRMVGATPAPQPQPQEEDDMRWLLKKANDPKVYVTDLGLNTRHVQDSAEEALLIALMAKQGRTVGVEVAPDWLIDRLVAAAGTGAQH